MHATLIVKDSARTKSDPVTALSHRVCGTSLVCRFCDRVMRNSLLDLQEASS
jgi:hypothetical protein